ncbi:MAG: GNAT family N-acetyltransferase [Defluviitaleaceae bacterium]|nr:GNAT family N-acetyltransferase [Defluviitaleaceae bacterium]
MKIIRTTHYEPLQLHNEQEKQISSPERIQKALQLDDCLGFYLYEKESTNIGFALLRKFDEKQFFLWNFLIDCRYQGCGKGKEFLGMLIDMLRKDYCAEVIATTYLYGNEVAKRLYESFSFVQVDIVDENGVHEVNMELLCR